MPLRQGTMSFRRNVLASYVSQIYATLIGIVLVPVYIRYMGVEAYGLVGFYAMLQAWFQLLDLGLAPTIQREAARSTGGAVDALTLHRLLRVLEIIFASVACAGAIGLSAASGWVASHWLRVEHLPLDQVQAAVSLMACIVGLRWMAGLYRGAIGGFEQQVWLGRLNLITATARFVFVVPIFEWIGTAPSLFFAYQLFVAVIETVLLARFTHRLLPRRPPGTPPVGLHWRALKDVLPFSLSIAFTSSVWVAVTQSDKLLLSRLLPLADYAQFTLAVLVASGVSIVSGPLSTALLPRLSRLQAQHDDAGLIVLYRQATQGMAVIALPVAFMLVCGAYPLLRAWTGDGALAAGSAPILQLYGLGNGILALSAFPYYLQFAKGDVRLHVFGNVLFVLVLIPSVTLATLKHGALGAGWAWLIANGLYALLWVPLVHRRFAPGLHWRWLLSDIAPIAITAALSAWTLTRLAPWPAHRGAAIGLFFALGLLTLVAALPASSEIRSRLRGKLRPD